MINPYSSVGISKDKYLQIPLVPEPTSLGLIAVGILGWAARRRSR